MFTILKHAIRGASYIRTFAMLGHRLPMEVQHIFSTSKGNPIVAK